MTIRKLCIECGDKKSHSDFYAHPRMKDGTVNVCKVCHKARMKRRRMTNPRVQEYDRLRYQQPERKRHTIEVARLWRIKHPAAYKAQSAVSNAIRSGRLTKRPCETCGETKHVHGHHNNYHKPLDVIWLCAKCHHRLHAASPELGGHFSAGSQ